MSRNTGIIVVVILLIVILTIVGLRFMPRGNGNGGAIGGYWEKEIKSIDVSPDASNCLGESPKQYFNARLSKQYPGTEYQGTVLFLSSAPTTSYVSDLGSSYNAKRQLELGLWKKGFKIVELKFSSKIGYNPTPADLPDEQWRENGLVCETQPFIKAYDILINQGILPSEQEKRYAFGSSNGAMMLAYSIDYFKTTTFNRVIMQSPVVSDVYSWCVEDPNTILGAFYFLWKGRHSIYMGLNDYRSAKRTDSPSCTNTSCTTEEQSSDFKSDW